MNIRLSDDYVDVLPLAESYSKDVTQWLTLPSTIKLAEIIDERSEVRDKYQEEYFGFATELISTIKGLQVALWIHPDLVYDFVNWVDFEMTLKITKWLQDYQLEKKTKSLKSEIEDLKTALNELKAGPVEKDSKEAICDSFIRMDAKGNIAIGSTNLRENEQMASNQPSAPLNEKVLYVASTREDAKEGHYMIDSTNSRIDVHFKDLNNQRIGCPKLAPLRIIRAPNITKLKNFIERYFEDYHTRDNWFCINYEQLCHELAIIEQLYHDAPHLFENFEMAMDVCKSMRSAKQEVFEWDLLSKNRAAIF